MRLFPEIPHRDGRWSATERHLHDGAPGHVGMRSVARHAVAAALSRSVVLICWREAMPSLAKTLRRCYSTVCGLMKSWAPISGFVNPSQARWATCDSCAVSALAGRLRALSPAACNIPGVLGYNAHTRC